MDEAMDTSSDSPETSDLQMRNDDDFRHSSSMDTSPILIRRAVRHFPRTPRNRVSSSGWISTAIPLQLPISAALAEDVASASNLLNESSRPSNSEDPDISDTIQPPPIEDTDLIMIHRPVSLSALDPVSTGAPTDDRMEGREELANEHVPPHPESSNDSTSQSIMEEIEIRDNNQEDEVTSESEPVPPLPAVQSSSSAAPDVENLPLAQRIRSPDLISPERSPPLKKVRVEPEEEKVQKQEESYEEEEGKLCPICFDAWTNSGEHRLVALRCGHLFGQQCIQHWLQIHKANDRKCPQCKKKATVKDIRPLYASKIRVLDTSEQEALKETIKRLEEEKERLSRELAFERQMHQDAVRIQKEQQIKLQELQNQGIFSQSVQQPLPNTSRQVASIAAQIKISLTNRIEVSRDGGCRVLAFNEWKSVLVASQSSVSALFPDFGIRFIDTDEFRLRQLMPIHTKPIRDLSFNPHRKDLLLSASLDKTAKMFCMSSNSSVMTFHAEMPLWSCCWDGNNPNICFVGSQNGTTLQYDIRNTHTEVSRITTQGDGAPVISLSAVPAGNWLPNGGFLSCRLNRFRVYERTSNSEFRPYPLSIEGPFSALNYNHNTQHVLVSTRPTTQNPHVQHQLYQMGFSGTQPHANMIHSFVGGTTQRVMSRPCQIEIDGNTKDTLVCAHQESEGHVAIWSVTNGQKLPVGPLHCSDPVMDLCPLKLNNKNFLASLSEKSLRIYQFS